MKVALDGWKAVMDSGHDGCCSRAVIGSLVRTFPGCNFDVYVPGKGGNAFLNSISGLENVRICRVSGFLSRLSVSLWHRYLDCHILPQDPPDIFHSADGVLSGCIGKIRGIKAVATVYDLSFLSSREGFSWLQRHRSSALIRRTCRTADRIIVHDRDVAAGLVRYYFLPKDTITVVSVPKDSPDGVPQAAEDIMAVYRSLLYGG